MSEVIEKFYILKNDYSDSCKKGENTGCIRKKLESHIDTYIKYSAYTREIIYCIKMNNKIDDDKISILNNVKISYEYNNINISSKLDYEEQFIHFIDDIHSGIKATTEEDKIINKINEKIEKWKYFIGSGNEEIKKLSEESEIGLLGELKTLEYIIDKLDIDVALNSWVGPDYNPKDFRLENIEIETKSTRNQLIKINGIDQLDISEGKDLFINVHCIIENDEGYTISDIIEKIKRKIISEQIKEKFMHKVYKYGYVPKDEYISQKKYKILNSCFYKVNENFPKITKSDLIHKEAIKNVSYSIDLESIDKENKVDEVLKIVNQNL